MINKRLCLSLITAITLTGCDFLESSLESSKTEIEAQYLENNQTIKEAIETIRQQGLETVNQTAAQGSVAQCIAEKLANDPMGNLIQVEGVLQETESLNQFIEKIANFQEQELSLDNLSNLISQGTESLNYIGVLLETYTLEELQQQIVAITQKGVDKTENIGTHLRDIVETCQ